MGSLFSSSQQNEGLHFCCCSWLLPLPPPLPTLVSLVDMLASLEDMLGSLEDTVLSLVPVPSVELASLEDTAWLEELVTESLEGSAMESVSATVLLEALATVLLVELASVLEECTTATPDTTAPPSSTPLSSVRNVIANSSLSVKEIYLFYLLK